MTNIAIEFLASILIWIMFAGVFILWLIDGRVKKEEALHALIASIFSWVVAGMIKSLLPTPRPFMINGSSPLVLWGQVSNGGFPSGHAAAAFGLAVTIWLHDKKLGAVYLLLALLVGAGRVVANVHYPLDIVGGAVLGSLVAFLVDRLHVYKLLGQRGKL